MSQTDETLKFASAGFFVLRTPLLPVDELLQWSQDLKIPDLPAADSHAAKFDHAWRADITMLRARLERIIARPEILHALFLASPSLVASIDSWKRDPDSKKGLQTERALVRYLLRMTGRATPFGLFAGCSVGEVATGDKTELTLQARRDYRTCSRLDFDYLFALTSNLRGNAELRNQLKYRPNSSLHRVGTVYHYIESRIVESRRQHHVVKIFSDQFLDTVLERASNGAILAELVEALQHFSNSPDDEKVSEIEAQAYLQDLIRCEVLVSNLSPLVTGDPPINDIISQLTPFACAKGVVEVLEWVRKKMAFLDSTGLGVSPSEYQAITSKIETLDTKPNGARLYQVDLTKPCSELSLGQPVIAEILKGIEVLARFVPIRESNELSIFREAFLEKYQGASVPLLEALDQEVGVGFGHSMMSDGSPLLRDLEFGNAAELTQSTASPLHAFLLQKVVECDHDQRNELELNISELPTVKIATLQLPDSFAMRATVVATSSAAICHGDFKIHLDGGYGPSGARLFGRFCQADAKLDSYVRRLLQHEEAHQSDAVYAEVVHLPEGRVGNVLCRPVLRDYEIVYLGRSGAPEDRQLPTTDLLVSVEHGRLALHSQKLGCRVIPRITNAHGYLSPALPPIYRFLGLMQEEPGTRVPSFRWGPLETLTALPRVTTGRLVLSRARWRLTDIELASVRKCERQNCFKFIQELRHRRTLPRWVVFAEADNFLPVDLENALSVDALVHILKRADQAVFLEMYPPADELCVSSPEGRFFHEMIIPFVKTFPNATTSRNLPRNDAPRSAKRSSSPIAIEKSFPPGSEWLYIKIYGGPATLDEILISVVPKILRTALETGAILGWFFVRYSDPHEHLRIRFKCAQGRFAQDLVPLLTAFNDLLRNGQNWKIQLDTYEREIQRYGGFEGMLAAEEIFFADSCAVLNILQDLEGDEGMDVRWRISLLGADALLSDFGFDLQDKCAVMKRLVRAYQSEFQVSFNFTKQLGKKFRTERQSLEDLFNRTPTAQYENARRALETRSIGIAPAIRMLRTLSASGKLHTEIPDVVNSHIHMHLNRMIRGAQRRHELVIYDLLSRLYEGRWAREQNGSI